MPGAISTVIVVDDDPPSESRSVACFDPSSCKRSCSPRWTNSSRPAVRTDRPAWVLEVRLPGRSSLDLQRELGAANIHLPIIFITGYGTSQYPSGDDPSCNQDALPRDMNRLGSPELVLNSVVARQRHQLGVTARRCVPARRQEGPLSALGRPPAASQNGTLRIFWRSHPASPGSSRAGGGQLTLSCKVVKSSLDPQPAG